jgi:cell division protein FtsN
MERKKILWIIIAVGATLTIILALGLVLVSGGKTRMPLDPATLNLKASPRISFPEDFARPGASILPTASPSPNQDGDVIVVYGENPDFASPLPRTSAMPAGQVAMNPETAQPTPGWASAKPANPTAATPKPRVSTPVVAKNLPEKPAAKAPVSNAKPKLITMTEYWIQAASFKSKGHAEEFKASLASSGLSSIIRTKDVDGQTLYQIRIGPYSTTREADGWLSRIQKLPDCTKAYRTIVYAKHSI